MSACRGNKQQGFSVIELMVAVAIMAILVGIAMPSFQTWVQNTQIRNAAESILSGLQRARAEAVARNRSVAFALQGGDSSWTISLVTPASGIESRSSSEGSKNVTITAVAADLATEATAITFNNLGSVVTPNPTDNSEPLARVDVDLPGNNRNLRIVIGVGGSAKMCDPNQSPGSGLSAC